LGAGQGLLVSRYNEALGDDLEADLSG